MGGSAAARAHHRVSKCRREKAGRAVLSMHEAVVEAVLKPRANALTWHFDSAVNEEAGIKEAGTLGNDSIKEAVKRVIRQIE